MQRSRATPYRCLGRALSGHSLDHRKLLPVLVLPWRQCRAQCPAGSTPSGTATHAAAPESSPTAPMLWPCVVVAAVRTHYATARDRSAGLCVLCLYIDDGHYSSCGVPIDVVVREARRPAAPLAH